MRLVRLHIAGFGRLADVTIDFADGLTIVSGPNEAGKSTIVECLLRLLFGYPKLQFNEDRKRYEPWGAGVPFAASLSYRLDDGRTFEVARDFGKPDVPTETVEFDTRRPVKELSGNKSASPGEELLGISLDVFRAAALVSATDLSKDLDDKTTRALADRLAAAVGSGGDASAAGAIERLQKVWRDIGKDGPNTPLGRASAESAAADEALRRYREHYAGFAATLQQRAALEDDIRELTSRLARCSAAFAAAKLRSIRARITLGAERREALAAAEARRSSVATLSPAATSRRQDVDAAALALRTAQQVEQETTSRAAAQSDERTARQRDLDAATGALVEKRAASKKLDEVIAGYEAATEGRPEISADAMADLERLSDDAEHAEGFKRARETKAAIARQRQSPPALLSMLSFAIAIVFAVVWAFTHNPIFLALGAVAAAAGAALAFGRLGTVRKRSADIRAAEAEAEAAGGAAEAASAALTARCRALGCTSIAAVRAARTAQLELDRVRAQRGSAAAEVDSLTVKRDAAQARLSDITALATEADAARKRIESAKAALSSLLDEVAIAPGPLEDRLAAFRNAVDSGADEARAETAIANARSALDRELGGETFEALEEDAARYGAEAAMGGDPGEFAHHSEADLDRELGAIGEQRTEAIRLLEGSKQRIDEFERLHPIAIADLEERAASTNALRDRLETCKAAAKIAWETIESVKDVVHKDFTPRMNAAVARSAEAITAGRYVDARVDQADFTVRVRVPETGQYVDASTLSTGTLEQIQFALRSAAAEALGSGERVPMLYDDALAHADDDRLRAALEFASSLSRAGAQIVFFTQRGDIEALAPLEDGVRVVRLAGPRG